MKSVWLRMFDDSVWREVCVIRVCGKLCEISIWDEECVIKNVWWQYICEEFDKECGEMCVW